MQTKKFWRSALALLPLCGCASPYWFPAEYETIEGYEGIETEGIVQGDAGHFTGIHTATPFSMTSWSEGSYEELDYMADVPVEGGSVFVDVLIGGTERLLVGEPLHFTEPYQEIDGVWLDVYVCPNGDGASGSADDIVLTRLEDGTVTVVATSQVPAQNLDLDVEVAAALPPVERVRPERPEMITTTR
jgi:hypothetical protein